VLSLTRLWQAGAPGLHFYTLNQESVTYGIIHELERLKHEAREPTLAAKIVSNSILALVTVASLFILSERFMHSSR
jgi:hypothetical protein